ncbi:MAG TPA: phosphorylase, partial [Cryomorphaceae bacterium]|nr:phosphorylase [Cryomorphaceae bacterium]
MKDPVAKSSELILNKDGSLYHLALRKGEVAEKIITVGDPDRVSEVSRHFDRIEVERKAREFVSCTGTLNGERLSVISTGIGTDNVDIVMN